MANFFVSLTNEEIAGQIAFLINKYNNLYIVHNWFTVNSSTIDYFVEIIGNRVIGCAGILKETGNWSLIKHVCVAPEFRNKGIAIKLINTAIQNCKTEYVYMTIRENNLASLNMAKTLGFNTIKREWSKNHYIVAVGRKTNNETNCSNSGKY